MMKKLLCIAALAIGTAQAAPIYLVNATTDTLPPAGDFSNLAFSFTYEDFNQDMVFSLPELLAFGGYFDGVGFYDQLLDVPMVPGIEGSGNGMEWRFGDGVTTISFAASTFTPFTERVGGQVPAPGALLLALTGLALLPRRQR